MLANNIYFWHLAFSEDEVTEFHEDPQNVGGQGRLAMRHYLSKGRHLNKDSYETNHNTDQFADERETVIRYADAQPIAHDVREIEKKKGVV